MGNTSKSASFRSWGQARTNPATTAVLDYVGRCLHQMYATWRLGKAMRVFCLFDGFQ